MEYKIENYKQVKIRCITCKQFCDQCNTKICKNCKSNPVYVIKKRDAMKIYKLKGNQINVTPIATNKYLVSDIQKLAYDVHSQNKSDKVRENMLQLIEIEKNKIRISEYVHTKYFDILDGKNLYNSMLTGKTSYNFFTDISDLIEKSVLTQNSFDEICVMVENIFQQYKEKEKNKQDIRLVMRNYIENKFCDIDKIFEICNLEKEQSDIIKYISEMDKHVFDIYRIIFDTTGNRSFWNRKIFFQLNVIRTLRHFCSHDITVDNNVYINNIAMLIRLALFESKELYIMIENIDPNIKTENDLEKANFLNELSIITKSICKYITDVTVNITAQMISIPKIPYPFSNEQSECMDHSREILHNYRTKYNLLVPPLPTIDNFCAKHKIPIIMATMPQQ